MTTFSYTARDSSGQSVSGVLSASTSADALKMLRADGKYPISIKAGDSSHASGSRPSVPNRGVKVSRAEVIQFANQLAIMVETGVVLSDALDCIGKQAETPPMKALLADLTQQLQSGSTFSDALARHPRSFPTVFVALMRASEKSGMMSRLLNRATGYLRDEQETLRKVRGALTYPAIMFSFALLTTIALLIFVLPRFTTIYASKKSALPLPTKLLMGLSDFLINQWPLLLVALAILGGLAWFYFRTASGLRLWHFAQLHVPLFGKLYRKLHLSRGLRMAGTMAGAGVALHECVNTAHDLCSNVYFRDLWRRVGNQIQTGRQLSDPLFESPLVPRSVAQMISSGEKSGKLAQVMEQVSSYAEVELKDEIANLTRYIEPIMIIGMGVIIGGVTLALLLPIFTISKVMSAPG